MFHVSLEGAGSSSRYQRDVFGIAAGIPNNSAKAGFA